jgi:hypothetical protein
MKHSGYGFFGIPHAILLFFRDVLIAQRSYPIHDETSSAFMKRPVQFDHRGKPFVELLFRVIPLYDFHEEASYAHGCTERATFDVYYISTAISIHEEECLEIFQIMIVIIVNETLYPSAMCNHAGHLVLICFSAPGNTTPKQRPRVFPLQASAQARISHDRENG